MNYNIHPQEKAFRARRLPWLMFLFLAAIFFFVYNDWSYSKKEIDN
jgi:hypothetical protein